MSRTLAELRDPCGLPYDPEHVHLVAGGHVKHRCGLDITDVELTWRCASGHIWQATVIDRVNPLHPGCPHCRH